jgi:hypothetical protein
MMTYLSGPSSSSSALQQRSHMPTAFGGRPPACPPSAADAAAQAAVLAAAQAAAASLLRHPQAGGSPSDYDADGEASDEEARAPSACPPTGATPQLKAVPSWHRATLWALPGEEAAAPPARAEAGAGAGAAGSAGCASTQAGAGDCAASMTTTWGELPSCQAQAGPAAAWAGGEHEQRSEAADAWRYRFAHR